VEAFKFVCVSLFALGADLSIGETVQDFGGDEETVLSIAQDTVPGTKSHSIAFFRYGLRGRYSSERDEVEELKKVVWKIWHDAEMRENVKRGNVCTIKPLSFFRSCLMIHTDLGRPRTLAAYAACGTALIGPVLDQTRSLGIA
jgi:hypothetical protein